MYKEVVSMHSKNRKNVLITLPVAISQLTAINPSINMLAKRFSDREQVESLTKTVLDSRHGRTVTS